MRTHRLNFGNRLEKGNLFFCSKQEFRDYHQLEYNAFLRKYPKHEEVSRQCDKEYNRQLMMGTYDEKLWMLPGQERDHFSVTQTYAIDYGPEENERNSR